MAISSQWTGNFVNNLVNSEEKAKVMVGLYLKTYQKHRKFIFVLEQILYTQGIWMFKSWMHEFIYWVSYVLFDP